MELIRNDENLMVKIQSSVSCEGFNLFQERNWMIGDRLEITYQRIFKDLYEKLIVKTLLTGFRPTGWRPPADSIR